MTELSCADVDDLRRAVAKGKAAELSNRPCPMALSLGAAVELACWSASPEFRADEHVRDLLRAWVVQMPLLRATVSAVYRRPLPELRLETGAIVVRPCPTRAELKQDAGAGWIDFLFDATEPAQRVVQFDDTWRMQLALLISELADNIVLHSDVGDEDERRGVVAFRASTGRLEITVGDVGIGVGASLRRNPLYAGLATEIQALRAVVRDGASRSRSDPRDHGGGMDQLFRTLATRNGRLRFRSHDAALAVDGNLDRVHERTSPSPRMHGFQVYMDLQFPT